MLKLRKMLSTTSIDKTGPSDNDIPIKKGIKIIWFNYDKIGSHS